MVFLPGLGVDMLVQLVARPRFQLSQPTEVRMLSKPVVTRLVARHGPTARVVLAVAQALGMSVALSRPVQPVVLAVAAVARVARVLLPQVRGQVGLAVQVWSAVSQAHR